MLNHTGWKVRKNPATGEVFFSTFPFIELTGKPVIISREKVKEAQCRHWTCDTRRAAQELGFEAQTPLELGLAQTLAWYKEAGWLKY